VCVWVNYDFCAHLLQFDSSDTYAGSAFSLGETVSANHSGHHITGRSASGCNPWQTRSRPTYSPAVHLPHYNGVHGTVAAPRFTSRRTPFSYNDSPPETVKVQHRPAATSVVNSASKVPYLLCCSKNVALFGFYFAMLCIAWSLLSCSVRLSILPSNFFIAWWL